MTTAATAVFFDRWRTRIEQLLHEQADMGVVEHAIDAAYALDGEEKDALWLWAHWRRDRLASGAPERPIIGSTARTEAADPADDLSS
jgi:hypothetical protein